MTRRRLVAPPFVVRRAMKGLAHVAAQAERIDIDQRGVQLPLDEVPVEIARWSRRSMPRSIASTRATSATVASSPMPRTSSAPRSLYCQRGWPRSRRAGEDLSARGRHPAQRHGRPALLDLQRPGSAGRYDQPRSISSRKSAGDRSKLDSRAARLRRRL